MSDFDRGVQAERARVVHGIRAALVLAPYGSVEARTLQDLYRDLYPVADRDWPVPCSPSALRASRST